MKKITTLLCLLILVANAAFAQIVVKGTIKDAKGEPVPGAVVMLENDSRTGSVTDIDGKYAIIFPSSAKQNLQISCIGYKTQTIAVQNRSVVDAVLEDDAELLDEVVVVGYGAMRRSDLTGSVASVKIDEENAMKSVTLDQILEGRAAGVQVLNDTGDPDGGVSIQVRGISTFSGNSDPLYVVDGVIISGETTSVASVSSSVSLDESRSHATVNPLSGINPNDIASMEILKDASATAIYGSQGANGVVLITTKQANREKPVINFNAGVSIAEPMKRVDILSWDEYLDKLVITGNSSLISDFYEDPVNRTGLKVTPIDWQDYIFRTAVSQRYYFSVSGKPSGYNYFFSVGYNSTQGILRNTDSDALTARLNISKDIAKNVKLSFKSTFGYTFSNIQNGGAGGSAMNGYSSLMQSAVISRPYLYKDPNKEDDDIDEELEETDDYTRWNPKRMQEGSTKTVKRFRVTPSLSLDWKILKWLSFRSTFGADFTTNNNRNSKMDIVSNGVGNIAGYGDSKSLRWNWDNLLMFNQKWGKHNLNGTIGQSASRNQRSSQTISARNLPQRYAYGDNINEAATEYSYLDSYAAYQNTLMSFFGRAVYNYADRYVLTATLRFDGSSRFKGSNKWGIFPSLAFAWRLASEPWFNVPCISNAKIRVGWGQVGNQNIGDYLTAPLIATQYVANHASVSGKEVGIYQSNIVNEGLMWETTNQTNIGFDLSFFKGRIALTADWYDKRTLNLLQSKPVASSSGFSTMSVNDGCIQNRGFEFSIDTVPVKTKTVEWSVGGNISFNRNKLVDVGAMGNSATIYINPGDDPTPVKYFVGSAIHSAYALSTAPNIFVEGYPMGLFYGYKYGGVVQEGETHQIAEDTPLAPGYLWYQDLDGDNIITVADRCILGNPNPDFTYGFNTSLSFKSLSFTMNFIGSYGNDRLNANRVLGAYTTNGGRNNYGYAIREGWQPENKLNLYGRPNTTNNTNFSDVLIEDGSYLRISNISLSYNVPIKKTSKVLHGLGISLSVTNPYIFTHYSGYSPVVNTFGNDIKKMGVDSNTTPYPRSYNVDLKFTF